MLIDLIAFILLLAAVFKGWRNGLVMAVFSLLAFIIGLTAAIKLSAAVAGHIGSAVNVSQRWLPFIAFTLVFICVAYGVKLGARAVEAGMRLVLLGWLNRLAGILFYGLLYFFIFSILLFYAVQLHIVKAETVSASTFYPYIRPIGPAIINSIGSITPFLKNMFAELEHFFNSLTM